MLPASPVTVSYWRPLLREGVQDAPRKSASPSRIFEQGRPSVHIRSQLFCHWRDGSASLMRRAPHTEMDSKRQLRVYFEEQGQTFMAASPSSQRVRPRRYGKRSHGVMVSMSANALVSRSPCTWPNRWPRKSSCTQAAHQCTQPAMPVVGCVSDMHLHLTCKPVQAVGNKNAGFTAAPADDNQATGPMKDIPSDRSSASEQALPVCSRPAGHTAGPAGSSELLMQADAAYGDTEDKRLTQVPST